MSQQQKDTASSGGTGAGSQGLRKQDRDDTGGPRGDALSNAVDAALTGVEGGKGSTGSTPPPAGKDGASKA